MARPGPLTPEKSHKSGAAMGWVDQWIESRTKNKIKSKGLRAGWCLLAAAYT